MANRPASAVIAATPIPLRTLAPLVTLLMSLSAGVHGQATIMPGTGDQMLQGMMNMMGQFAQQMQQPAQMSGQMMTAPATAMGAIPGFDAGSGMLPPPQATPAPPAPAMPTTPTALDGAWRADSGEYLLIEGERFRLHADSKRYIDGRLRTRGDIVGLLYPKRRTALLYRYQISGDQLQLRDQQGQTLRYRRVRRSR